MRRLAFLIPLFLALFARAQNGKIGEIRVEVPASGRTAATVAPLTTIAPLAAAAAPVAAPIYTPAVPSSSLTRRAPSVSASIQAPAVHADPHADAAERPAPGAIGELKEGGRLSARPGEDAGMRTFDGGTANGAGENLFVSEAPAAPAGSRLSPADERAPRPAHAVPLGQRLRETADLGFTALGFQLVALIGFLILGAHSSFPAAAGAFWVLAGGEMVAQLRKLRQFIVGGWQASHDQKMRHHYDTGKLIDIRGHKYGEDRYEAFAPGAASPRERFVLGATAILMGLPWVLPAGPKAVALYALGAAATHAARLAWRRIHPEEAQQEKPARFEYDR